MKKTIKATYQEGRKYVNKLVKAIRAEYNLDGDEEEGKTYDEIYIIDAEIDYDNKKVEFYVNEEVYEEVLEKLKASEAIKIAGEEVKEEVEEEVKEENTVTTYLEKLGLKVWEKGEHKRVYINDLMLVGLEEVCKSNTKRIAKNTMYYNIVQDTFCYDVSSSVEQHMIALENKIREDASK